MSTTQRGTLKKAVLHCLSTMPATRDDDRKLYMAVIQYLEKQTYMYSIPVDLIFKYRQATIVRLRAFIQNHDGLYPPSEKASNLRLMQQDEEREYYSPRQ